MDPAAEECWRQLEEVAQAFSDGTGPAFALQAALESVGTTPSPALAHAAEVAGDLFRARRYAGPAADAYRLALETHNALEETDPEAVVRVLRSLGQICDLLGGESETLLCYEQAIPLLERLHGEMDPLLPTLLNDAGVLLRHAGEFEKSAQHFERALALLERRLGPDHLDLAPILNNFGLLLAQTGDLSGAEARHIRALTIRERAFGPKHPDVAQSLANLAAAQHQAGRTEDACNLYARAYVILKNQGKPDPSELATITENYLAILRATGQDARADEIARRNGLAA